MDIENGGDTIKKTVEKQEGSPAAVNIFLENHEPQLLIVTHYILANESQCWIFWTIVHVILTETKGWKSGCVLATGVSVGSLLRPKYGDPHTNRRVNIDPFKNKDDQQLKVLIMILTGCLLAKGVCHGLEH